MGRRKLYRKAVKVWKGEALDHLCNDSPAVVLWDFAKLSKCNYEGDPEELVAKLLIIVECLIVEKKLSESSIDEVMLLNLRSAQEKLKTEKQR